MAFNKKEGPNMDISVILRKGNKIIMGDSRWKRSGKERGREGKRRAGS